MPALRLSPRMSFTERDKELGITCKIKILDAKEPRSDMGLIADTFRQLEGTMVGDGVFRIAVWKQSEEWGP